LGLAAGTRLGPYEVTTQIGVGGMGEVYRAVDTNLKRQVAVKVLPDSVALDAARLARFQREAEVLASLNHPNIAAIYGLERAGDVTALVMELVEGETLAERIAQSPLTLGDAMPIARQITAALEAAHEQGIVHRDLKPANIKVRPDGRVKLLDFGLAKIADGGMLPSSSGVAGLTQSPTMTRGATEVGMILGTAAYMSPEQARGRPADQRTDIWAFGVLLAEMVTGRQLFGGDTTSDIIASVLTREPDISDVPPPLRRLVRMCLAKDPQDRPRHIGDVLLFVEESSAAPPAADSGGGVPNWWRRWVYPATMAVALAIGAALAPVALRRDAIVEAVTRFYVDAPAGSAFNYTYTATAISPDGRHIVFRVATAEEAPAFWLRPLDALEGRRIAGTDGGDFPFWSPDGRSIGFFATGKLKRVDIEGSSPIVLADAADVDTTTSGGSWNRAGVIIFGSPQGMYRVSASGGTPVLFAPVNAEAGETGYGSPQFLPDGDRFLLFVRHDDPARRGIYVSSLSRPEQKTRVLATGRKAVFTGGEDDEPSYLLYLQDGTLLGQRIDGRTLALSGDPVPLSAGVARFPPGFHASFWSSASGNLLVYRSEASDKPRLTWLYGDGKRQTETGTEDFFTHVRVTADGSRAALELADATGNMDVWTVDFARNAKLRQTFDPKPDRAPTWSPDGRYVAFSSLRTGNWQIFRKDVQSGRPEEQLTTGTEDKIVPLWSRDGRYILFIQISATTAEDIWAIPLDGDRKPFPVLATPFLETSPSLSPDGQWLAFESPHTGRPEVFVTRFPASPAQIDAAAPRWQISTAGGSRPRWSGDGRSLLYVSLDDASIMRAAVRAGAAGIESDAPVVFARIPVMPVARSPFDVTADGRVLVLERTIQGAALSLVTNWHRLMQER
jgi:Tol biopolymer transport system component